MTRTIPLIRIRMFPFPVTVMLELSPNFTESLKLPSRLSKNFFLPHMWLLQPKLRNCTSFSQTSTTAIKHLSISFCIISFYPFTWTFISKMFELMAIEALNDRLIKEMSTSSFSPLNPLRSGPRPLPRT